MKNKSFAVILSAVAISVFAGLSIVAYLVFTGTPTKIFVLIDRGIYYNYFHYKDCKDLPLYETAKKEFETNKTGLEELVIRLSNINASTEVNKAEITENEIRTGYITIRLMEKCDNPTKAELHIDVLGDSQAQGIIAYFEKNNISIPYNIING